MTHCLRVGRPWYTAGHRTRLGIWTAAHNAEAVQAQIRGAALPAGAFTSILCKQGGSGGGGNSGNGGGDGGSGGDDTAEAGSADVRLLWEMCAQWGLHPTAVLVVAEDAHDAATAGQWVHPGQSPRCHLKPGTFSSRAVTVAPSRYSCDLGSTPWLSPRRLNPVAAVAASGHECGPGWNSWHAGGERS